MLKLRDSKTGKATEVPDGTFVEICDQAGAVAMLIYRDPQGLIRTVRSTDAEAVRRYCALYKTSFVPLVPLGLQPR